MSQTRISDLPNLSPAAGQPNLTGVRRLWLIEARHVADIIDPATVPGDRASHILPEDALQLTAGAVVYFLSFSPRRCSYDEQEQASSQGVSYAGRIALTIPRDNPVTALVADRTSRRQWVAIFEDANDQVRVAGTVRQPLYVSHSFSTSAAERQLVFSTVTRYPAPFLSEADVAILEQYT